MDRYFCFDVGECSFKRIRCVWNAEMRMMLEGEEPWKICFQTPVGAAEALVREVPMLRDWINRFLGEKVFPFLMPERQPVTETYLIGFRQQQNDLFQFLARFELWLPRDVAQNDHHLMELAHLNRNDRKGLYKASACIADNANDVPATLLQLFHSSDVLRDCFVGQELPEQVLVTMRTTKHHHAKHCSEVGRVHHHDDIAYFEETWLHHRQIHLLLHPPSTSSKLLSDLCIRLLSMRVCFQNPLRI